MQVYWHSHKSDLQSSVGACGGAKQVNKRYRCPRLQWHPLDRAKVSLLVGGHCKSGISHCNDWFGTCPECHYRQGVTVTGVTISGDVCRKLKASLTSSCSEYANKKLQGHLITTLGSDDVTDWPCICENFGAHHHSALVFHSSMIDWTWLPIWAAELMSYRSYDHRKRTAEVPADSYYLGWEKSVIVSKCN